MGVTLNLHRRNFLFTAAASAAVLTAPAIAQAHVAAGSKSLTLTCLHSGNSANVIFKRHGRFVHDGCAKLNWVMRDWRNHKQRSVDPRLFDTLYDLQQSFDAHDNGLLLISGYRSPETNALLSSRSSGVAKTSFHLRAMAADIRIEGVSTSSLKRQAERLRRGGVGYYPRDGFVHVDTGPVRTW